MHLYTLLILYGFLLNTFIHSIMIFRRLIVPFDYKLVIASLLMDIFYIISILIHLCIYCRFSQCATRVRLYINLSCLFVCEASLQVMFVSQLCTFRKLFMHLKKLQLHEETTNLIENGSSKLYIFNTVKGIKKNHCL